MGDTTIILGSKDSCIIFRDDGTEEINLPHQEKTVEDPDPIALPSMMKALRCAMALNDSDVVACDHCGRIAGCEN